MIVLQNKAPLKKTDFHIGEAGKIYLPIIYLSVCNNNTLPHLAAHKITVS